VRDRVGIEPELLHLTASGGVIRGIDRILQKKLGGYLSPACDEDREGRRFEPSSAASSFVACCSEVNA
jgi:hypothetical protein